MLAAGMPEVKFLLDRQTGKFYFLPKSIPFHYNFAKEVLGVREGRQENAQVAVTRFDHEGCAHRAHRLVRRVRPCRRSLQRDRAPLAL